MKTQDLENKHAPSKMIWSKHRVCKWISRQLTNGNLRDNKAKLRLLCFLNYRFETLFLIWCHAPCRSCKTLGTNIGLTKMVLIDKKHLPYARIHFLSLFVMFSPFLTKGHLISKANYGLPTSSKKRMDEFDLFAFLLFTANKSNQIRSFFGRS